MRARLVAATCLSLSYVGCAAANAASMFLQIPGIAGEQSTPGHSKVIAVKSLHISFFGGTGAEFRIVKNVDSASPVIINAQESFLPSATALIYNATPSSQPDAILPFSNLFVGHSFPQFNGTEEDVFRAATPLSGFLELPGLLGAQSTPGHSGLFQLSMLLITPNEFTIVRRVDAASGLLFAAAAAGTSFGSATALFYNAANPAGRPDSALTFGNVVATSYSQPFDDREFEDVTFSFVTVPEPSSVALLFLGGLTAIGLGTSSIRRSSAYAELPRDR